MSGAVRPARPRGEQLVTGQLASYRVHLGTGDIFIGHGRHLCVVPDGWGAKRAVFLPFVDDADSRAIGEVLGLSPGAVDMRLTRARSLLRGLLGRWRDDV